MFLFLISSASVSADITLIVLEDNVFPFLTFIFGPLFLIIMIISSKNPIINNIPLIDLKIEFLFETTLHGFPLPLLGMSIIYVSSPSSQYKPHSFVKEQS